MIDHQATKIFTWFVEQVTEAWRTGGVNKSKVLLAEVLNYWETAVMENSLQYWSGRCA